MAKKWYTKEARFITPALNPLYFHAEGIYIDGSLFQNNTPILDNILRITVKPNRWCIVSHSISFGLPTYQGGQVGFLTKNFLWLPGQGHAQNDKIFSNGNPYGMGLNIIPVVCTAGPVDIMDIIYDASFIMEVTV